MIRLSTMCRPADRVLRDRLIVVAVTPRTIVGSNGAGMR
jgi:hypothetical protein